MKHVNKANLIYGMDVLRDTRTSMEKKDEIIK